MTELQDSPALGENSLIIVTFDEGVEQNYKIDTSGEITTILISPLARQGFVDPTRYSHYSLLKTILSAWNSAGTWPDRIGFDERNDGTLE